MITQLQTAHVAAAWLKCRVTGSLWADSRRITSGDGFIAWPGTAQDARLHVSDALNAGATACLVEGEGVERFEFTSDNIASYGGLKSASAQIAASFYKDPSKQLQTIAITGTNGKTSTAWWLAHALGKLNKKCGIVGTLGIGEPNALVPNGLTTPDPVLLQQQLRRFVDEGFSACAIEASSIGIAEHRLDATNFQVAVFTNFTQDHLDYHGSMQNYWAAKASLFKWPGLRAAVINVDDARGLALSLQLDAANLDVWTVAIDTPARVQAQLIQHSADQLTFDVVEANQRRTVTTKAIGLYNVSNLLGVMGAMRALGITLDDAATACCDLPTVPGRLNTLGGIGEPLLVIDYAHTPDAMQKVLTALAPVASGRGGKMWCVFGCGGGRDTAKRPLMAAVAQQYSDVVVVTSDNPRNENPETIIDQILLGLARRESVHTQVDRALAIGQAIADAAPQDVVLLAGKGHENYQEIQGVKLPFDDQLHAQAALKARSPAGAMS